MQYRLRTATGEIWLTLPLQSSGQKTFISWEGDRTRYILRSAPMRQICIRPKGCTWARNQVPRTVLILHKDWRDDIHSRYNKEGTALCGRQLCGQLVAGVVKQLKSVTIKEQLYSALCGMPGTLAFVTANHNCTLNVRSWIYGSLHCN